MKDKVELAAEYASERANKRAEEGRTFASDDRAIMAEVQMIGGALVTILIIALVLNEVYNAVEFEQDPETGEYLGPFGSVVGDLESTGVAAISLLIVGLIIVAASAIMNVFGGSGFGNGGGR